MRLCPAAQQGHLSSANALAKIWQPCQMQDAEVVLEDVGGSLSPSPDDCACHIQEGTWNKVGMLRKILEDTPRERAEWIVYMQPETFFDDTTFSIPFDSYRDKDLVLIGNETALRNGQMRGESTHFFCSCKSWNGVDL